MRSRSAGNMNRNCVMCPAATRWPAISLEKDPPFIKRLRDPKDLIHRRGKAEVWDLGFGVSHFRERERTRNSKAYPPQRTQSFAKFLLIIGFNRQHLLHELGARVRPLPQRAQSRPLGTVHRVPQRKARIPSLTLSRSLLPGIKVHFIPAHRILQPISEKSLS